MDKKKTLIIINAALYVLWALFTAGSVVAAYISGAAYRAQGHPEAWIFTQERTMDLFGISAPLLLAAIVMTVICNAEGISDGRQDRPIHDQAVISIYKAKREAVSDKTAEAAKDRKLRITRFALFAVAFTFVIAGILNGSMMDMLRKAVKICTECIGLG